jgi:hypothetical protein
VTHTSVATNLNCFAEMHAYMIKQQAIVIAECNEHTRSSQFFSQDTEFRDLAS